MFSDLQVQGVPNPLHLRIRNHGLPPAPASQWCRRLAGAGGRATPCTCESKSLFFWQGFGNWPLSYFFRSSAIISPAWWYFLHKSALRTQSKFQMVSLFDTDWVMLRFNSGLVALVNLAPGPADSSSFYLRESLGCNCVQCSASAVETHQIVIVICTLTHAVADIIIS